MCPCIENNVWKYCPSIKKYFWQKSLMTISPPNQIWLLQGGWFASSKKVATAFDFIACLTNLQIFVFFVKWQICKYLSNDKFTTICCCFVWSNEKCFKEYLWSKLLVIPSFVQSVTNRLKIYYLFIYLPSCACAPVK